MKLFETFGEVVLKDGGVESQLDKIDRKASALGSTLTKMAMTGVAIAGAALGALATKGVMLASDLQEVQNVVDTVFKDSAKEIDAFAKGAMKDFGLTELQAKKFSSTIGALVGSMGLTPEATKEMSLELTKLSGDMASFYNLKPEEAFDKLRAGIAGEAEPLKQLGINMSVVNLEAFALTQGITKSYQEMSQAEQATLRYNFVMNATAQSQGDFAKTSDSFANQLKIISGSFDTIAIAIGNKMLPYLQQFNAWVLDNMPTIQATIDTAIEIAVNAFNLLADAVKWVKDNLDWLIPVVAGFASGLLALNIINTVTGMVNAWRTSTLLQTIAQGGLNAVMKANPIGVVITLIGLLVAAGVALYMNWDTVKAKAIELWDAMKEQFTKIRDFVGGIFDTLMEKIDAFKKKVDDVVDGVKNAASAVASVFGGDSTPASSGKMNKGKASGGNVSKGNTYMVGENGRELFTPQVNGYIVPNSKLENTSKENATTEEKTINHMPITINTNSPFEVVKEVKLLNRMLAIGMV